MAIEIGGEIRENEELNEEKKIILEKLLDRDEEEPEVGERIFNISTSLFKTVVHLYFALF